jgi:hypothetical protein
MRALMVLMALAACRGDKDSAAPETAAPTTDPGTTPADDRDGDGWSDADDCGPDDPAVHPTAHEWCDGVDNDCDGAIDETFDLDQDGYLADDEADCRALGGELDCDDLDPDVHPGVDEVCDGRDTDCNGAVDDAGDQDGDGVQACEDCDDEDPFVYPGAAEAHDALDNDCSGAADEPWDNDGDGWSPVMGDCDDYDPYNAPDIVELCDGGDNDCDGEVDEGFDADEDGYYTCTGDCDDTDALINPSAIEICDGADNDCDGVVLDDLDEDGDGYTICDGDCNEGAPTAFPGGTELCNGIDDNCDGGIDETEECWGCSWDASHLFCEDKATWQVAADTCSAFGLTLTTLDDALENAAVAAYAASLHTGFGNPPAWWIGLNDLATEGTYAWDDGTALAYTNWYAGQPNDPGGTSDCVETNYQYNQGAGQWNDQTCTQNRSFICE